MDESRVFSLTMKTDPLKLRSGWIVFVLLTSGCGAVCAQEGAPEPAPQRDQPSPETPENPGRPFLTDKEVQQYRDLARELGEEIESMIRRGLRDAAGEVQRRLEQSGGERVPAEPVRERVEHLLKAAEHLAQAGLGEEAARLRKQADQLGRKPSGSPGQELEVLHKRLEQLERAVQELKQENRELRRLIEQKPL